MKIAAQRTGRLAAGLAAGALLAVQTQPQSFTFTKLWDIGTGVRDYITTDATERGIAVHPVSGDVILVSRAGGLNVVVLAGDTGEELRRLDTSGIGGGTYALSAVAVADDGVIYAANLVAPVMDFQLFTIYRWADANAAPTIAYQGNPSNEQRYGDSLDVRGSGANTQLAAGTGNAATAVRFTIFTTTDGKNFIANNFSPTGVGAGSLQKGIAFGPGDTVIGKTQDQDGQYVSFDLAAGNSSLLESVPIASAISPVDYDAANKLLAGVNYSTHQLLVYDASDPGLPLQLGSFAFPTPATANGNGVGAVDFGAGKLVAVDTQNGILAYKVEAPVKPEPPAIIAQPQDQAVLAGAKVVFSVEAAGAKPLWFQWHFNDAAIDGANAATCTLNNAQTNAAGTYKVVITNSVGSVTSSNAVLTVAPLVQSSRVTKLWSKSPGELPFLADDNAHRGLAFNPVSGNVLVASRTLGDTNVYVLDGNTGALKHRLRSTDASDANVIHGGDFPLNMIGAADDGAIYGCNLSTAGADLTIYRWADDNPDTIPTLAYGPDNPGLGRCGDAMAVRGAGVDTQIILSSRNAKTVAIFTTANGVTFTPTLITTADATDGNFGLGVAFGEGDSFWGKAAGASLRHVAFDLSAGTGTTLQDFPAASFQGTWGPIGVDLADNLLAAVSLDTPDNLQLYDLTDLSKPPVMLHQELFPTDNANLDGAGQVDFGGGRVYALDSNNGLVAYELMKAAQPPTLSEPKLLAAGEFSITLAGNAGVTYAIEASSDLSAWTEVASQTLGAPTTTMSVPTGGAPWRFYRAKVK
jgi:hypothetical protein